MTQHRAQAREAKGVETGRRLSSKSLTQSNRQCPEKSHSFPNQASVHPGTEFAVRERVVDHSRRSDVDAWLPPKILFEI